jgi:hypothetical protein
MKHLNRVNGSAAAKEVARFRKIEKLGLLTCYLIAGAISLLLSLRYDWEVAGAVFLAFVVATHLCFFVLFKPKCPFCGVALTQNGELEVGTLHLPKCIKCGVPFETPTTKESLN